jgi:hypothetical protein
MAKRWRSQELFLLLLRLWFGGGDELVAAADELFDFFPIDLASEAEGDPTVVANVRGFGEAGVLEKDGLGFFFDLDTKVFALVVGIDTKRLIAPFIEGMPELDDDLGVGKGEAKLLNSLEVGHIPPIC